MSLALKIVFIAQKELLVIFASPAFTILLESAIHVHRIVFLALKMEAALLARKAPTFLNLNAYRVKNIAFSALNKVTVLSVLSDTS